MVQVADELQRHLDEWRIKSAELGTELEQAREKCEKLKDESDELTKQCQQALKLSKEELRRTDCQEIFKERARLRTAQSQMEVEVKRIDEEIEKRLVMITKEFEKARKEIIRIGRAEISDDLTGDELHEDSQGTMAEVLEVKQAKAKPGSSKKQTEAVARRHMRCWSCGGPHTKKVCPSRRRRQTTKQNLVTQSLSNRIGDLSRRVELMEKKWPEEDMSTKEAKFLKQVAGDRHKAKSEKDGESLKTDLANMVGQERRVAIWDEGQRPHRKLARVKKQNREVRTDRTSLTTRYRPDIQERIKKWRETRRRCTRRLEKDRGPNRKTEMKDEGEPPDSPPSGLA